MRPGAQKTCPRSVILIGRKIVAAVNSTEGMDLCWEYGADSWTEGGCHVFALAIQRWLGIPIKEAAVYNAEGEFEHILLELGENCYLDALGLGTGAEVVESWAKFLKRADLHVAPIDLVTERYRLSLDPEGAGKLLEHVMRLVDILSRRVGPGSQIAAELLKSKRAGTMVLFRGTPYPENVPVPRDFSGVFFSEDPVQAGQYGTYLQRYITGPQRLLDIDTPEATEVFKEFYGDFDEDSMVETFMFPDEKWAGILRSKGFAGTRIGKDVFLAWPFELSFIGRIENRRS